MTDEPNNIPPGLMIHDLHLEALRDIAKSLSTIADGVSWIASTLMAGTNERIADALSVLASHRASEGHGLSDHDKTKIAKAVEMLVEELDP